MVRRGFGAGVVVSVGQNKGNMAELQRVNASTIRRILAGDADAMQLDNFRWAPTPQGHGFWLYEFSLVTDGRGLSPEARAYLEGLLANGRRVCRKCNGAGEVPHYRVEGGGGVVGMAVEFDKMGDCPDCNGSGVKQ